MTIHRKLSSDKIERNIKRAFQAHKLVALIGAELGPDVSLGETLRMIEYLVHNLNRAYDRAAGNSTTASIYEGMNKSMDKIDQSENQNET